VELLMMNITQQSPWIVAGFSKDLEKMWKSQKAEFVASVDERRKDFAMLTTMQTTPLLRLATMLDIEDHCNWGPLAKHLETSRPVWNDIDLISFGGEKSVQNPLQSTVVLDNQNRLHCGRSQFESSSVQGCSRGAG
jgi:hypothetical protein